MKHLWLGICLFATLAGIRPLHADTVQPGKDAAEPDPRAKIEEIDKKVESLQQEKQQLERKAEEAERRARMREELNDIQRQGGERLQQIDKQIDEISKEEATDSAATQEQRKGRTAFLKAQRAVIEEAMAIKDIADLPMAKTLRERVEEMDAEWDLVRGPQLEVARRIEEFEKHLQGDEGTTVQRELLAKIRALCEEDLANRRAELAALKTRRANEKSFDALVDRFWNGK